MPGVLTPIFARREGRGLLATDIITFSKEKDNARKRRTNFTFPMFFVRINNYTYFNASYSEGTKPKQTSG